jgi:hypothetical protein
MNLTPIVQALKNAKVAYLITIGTDIQQTIVSELPTQQATLMIIEAMDDILLSELKNEEQGPLTKWIDNGKTDVVYMN